MEGEGGAARAQRVEDQTHPKRVGPPAGMRAVGTDSALCWHNGAHGACLPPRLRARQRARDFEHAFVAWRATKSANPSRTMDPPVQTSKQQACCQRSGQWAVKADAEARAQRRGERWTWRQRWCQRAHRT